MMYYFFPGTAKPMRAVTIFHANGRPVVKPNITAFLCKDLIFDGVGSLMQNDLECSYRIAAGIFRIGKHRNLAPHHHELPVGSISAVDK
jgi:hypothetical protein